MSTRLLADLSLIWLSLLCFVSLLPPIVIGYFAVRGMNVALNKTPLVMQKGQKWGHSMKEQTQILQGQVSTPILQVRARTDKFEQFVDKFGFSKQPQ